MCSIFGAYGHPDKKIIDHIRRSATDRGRDGGRIEHYVLSDGEAYLGNWRATPTPEVEKAPLQPYAGMIHNGTISNDKELGCQPGEVDSMILSRVLDRTSVRSLTESLSKVVGSYALACHNGKTVYLARNYKPIYLWSPDEVTTYFSSMERHFEGILPRGQAPKMLPAYSALDLKTWEEVKLPTSMSKRVVVICSSGLDSTTAAVKLQGEGWEVCLIHFKYRCRAEGREVRAVTEIAKALKYPLVFLTVPYGEMSGRSPLLSRGEEIAAGIKGAEYAFEWVPARNLVFISLAMAYAEANGYHAIALGNNLEESGAFPDNEEEMTHLLDQTCPYFVQNGYGMRVLSPVGNLMKHEIVALGLSIEVPYHLTWSCYKGGENHCGTCGPCYMRREAFKRCGAEDPVFTWLKDEHRIRDQMTCS